MEVEAGRLRHRVDVYKKVKKVNEQGKTVYVDEFMKHLNCEIVPQTGNMIRSQADTMLTQCTHKIICRYFSATEITKDMHITYKGRRFDIIYMLNPYESNESMEIFCKEVLT